MDWQRPRHCYPGAEPQRFFGVVALRRLRVSRGSCLLWLPARAALVCWAKWVLDLQEALRRERYSELESVASPLEHRQSLRQHAKEVRDALQLRRLAEK